MTVYIVLAIVALLSATMLTLKSWKTKDYSILGSVIPRIYLVATTLLIHFGFISVVFLPWAAIVVLFGDIINFILYSITYDINSKLLYFNPRLQLDNALFKLKTVMDNSIIPTFTVNPAGEFEYINEAFTNEFGIMQSQMVGQNFFALFNINPIEFETRLYTQFSYKEKQYVVKAFHTKNGHKTFTGTITNS